MNESTTDETKRFTGSASLAVVGAQIAHSCVQNHIRKHSFTTKL
jgi:hypothetical protein